MEFTTHLELHSQATRLCGFPRTLRLLLNGAITLSSCAFNRISRFLCSEFGRRLQRPRAFQVELFPLHSPLLRESLLVSFPPLSYMLKFSGFSYLISGNNRGGVGRRRLCPFRKRRYAPPQTNHNWEPTHPFVSLSLE